MALEEAKERARYWHKMTGLAYAVRVHCPLTDFTSGYRVMCLDGELNQRMVKFHWTMIVWCIKGGA